jgi:hypothetical protein
LRSISRETWIGIVSAAIGVAAMAVDHLLEAGGGFAADPPAFVASVALVLVVTAFVFGRVVPRVKADPEPPRAAIRPGFICAAIAVLLLPFTLWLGLPFPVAGGTLALGLIAREGERDRRRSATIMAAIGALVLMLGAAGYTAVAVDKLV